MNSQYSSLKFWTNSRRSRILEYFRKHDKFAFHLQTILTIRKPRKFIIPITVKLS